MDVLTQVLQCISQYGFPIVMCCITCLLWYKETKAHRAESEDWIQCIDKNTAILDRLLDKLDRG